MPKVSVIVPVYNTSMYLEKCVESIVKNEFDDFEIILVDDGSVDTSPEICDGLAQKYSNIKVIHKSNGGLTSARVCGLGVATGKYISFVDSDDYIEPNMLFELCEEVEKQKAEMGICGYNVIFKEKKKSVNLPVSSMNSKEEVMDFYVMPILGRIPGKTNLPGFVCIRLYSSSLLTPECFVSEKEFYSEDDILNLNVGIKVKRIAVVNKPLYNYVQRNDSLTYRFRDNAWNMLEHRYEYCKTFAKMYLNKYSEAKLRLVYNGFSGISKNIDNAIYGLEYELACSEIKKMMQSDVYREVMPMIQFWKLPLTSKITYMCLKLHLWRLLYQYRRSRQR